MTVSSGTKPAIDAFSVCKAGKISSGSVTCLSRSGSVSMASSTVIIFVREAGAVRSSARFCASTRPLWASSKIACRLAVSSRTFCRRNSTSSTSSAARIHSRRQRRWNRFMINRILFCKIVKRFHLVTRGKSAFSCKFAAMCFYVHVTKKAQRLSSQSFLLSRRLPNKVCGSVALLCTVQRSRFLLYMRALRRESFPYLQKCTAYSPAPRSRQKTE